MGDSHGSTLSLTGDGTDRPLGSNPEPVLVLVFECGRPHAGSVRYRLADLTGVTLGRGADRKAERAGSELTIQVPDKWMSSRHARLELSIGRWLFTDESKNGSVVDGYATKRTLLDDGSLIELGHSLFMFFESLPIQTNAPAVLELIPIDGVPSMNTLLPTWQAELARVHQMAPSAIPMLIESKGGVDTQVIARAIHDLSGRRGAFVPFTCGELPEGLVQRELFGDKDHEGLIRAASGGTLFLDDLGDLPASSQDALMHVLEERKLMPVGGTRAVEIDLRVIAATDRDLEDVLAKKTFRHDLFAWIAGFRVVVPPLSERRTDLGLLIGTLHQRLYAAGHPGFEIDAARTLLQYPWPLDVWELEQALAAAQILAGGELVRAEHLPETIRTGRPPGAPRPIALDAVEQELYDQVLAALREHRGNVSRMARALDKDRKQIQRWLKRFGFDPDRYR